MVLTILKIWDKLGSVQVREILAGVMHLILLLIPFWTASLQFSSASQFRQSSYYVSFRTIKIYACLAYRAIAELCYVSKQSLIKREVERNESYLISETPKLYLARVKSVAFNESFISPQDEP